MPVPNTMQDLFLAAASNFPTGSEAIGANLDNYLRSHAAIVRSTYATSSASIASAATTDVATSDAEHVTVTGNASINSLGTGYSGCYRECLFSGGATLVHSAALILPNAVNIVTANPDIIAFRCITAGNWIMVGSSRTSGSFSNISVTGTSTYNGVEIGWKGIPRTIQNGNYTFLVDDKGRCIAKTDTGTYTYTVNNGVHAAGDVVTVQNLGSSNNITIAQGAGVTLQLAGGTSTGNRTIPPGGLASIYFDAASHAVVTGAGVT